MRRALRLSGFLLKDGFEDLEEEVLASPGEQDDALEVPLELDCGSALAGLLVLADQVFNRSADGPGECRE